MRRFFVGLLRLIGDLLLLIGFGLIAMAGVFLAIYGLWWLIMNVIL